MVEINKGYYHSLDREYEMLNNLLSESSSSKKLSKPLLGIDEIGTSTPEGDRHGRLKQTVTAAMSRGVKEIELSLGPSNVMSGPASYSEEERQELREMARVNQVRFTSTHVSPSSVGNVSGLGERGFSERERHRQLNEIKQAIEFAGETNLGGAVVVHTGEFPRSISRADKEGLFTEFAAKEGEKERIHYFVDKRTGELLRELTVREDQVNHDFYYEGKKGGMVTNREDAATEIIHNKKVPKLYRDDEGNYRTYVKDWKDYEKEAKQSEKTPERLFFEDTMNANLEKATSQMLDFESRLEDAKNEEKYIRETVEEIKQDIKQAPEKEVYDWTQYGVQRLVGHLPPSERFGKDKKFMMEKLKQIEKNAGKKVASFHEAVTSSHRRVKEFERIKKLTVPISEYASKKSYDSLAQMGIEAMKETALAKRKFKDVEKVKDIFIAPENIFAEMGYGSHPDELIELVQKSRNQMATLLTKKELEEEDDQGKKQKVKNPFYREGLSEKDAEKLANRHIKATFDTEHLGMWKKYFTPKPGETREELDKRFNKWYLKEVKKMADKDVLGHIHMADTFGHAQAQLPPGAATMPIKDAVKHLKEKGYKGTLISEGFGDPLRQETAAWTYFGSPIYAVGGASPARFDQVHQGYFAGRSPYRSVTPPYYPSEDWQMWSEVPLD